MRGALVCAGGVREGIWAGGGSMRVGVWRVRGIAQPGVRRAAAARGRAASRLLQRLSQVGTWRRGRGREPPDSIASPPRHAESGRRRSDLHRVPTHAYAHCGARAGLYAPLRRGARFAARLGLLSFACRVVWEERGARRTVRVASSEGCGLSHTR
eukprot:2339285-Prymnesium_polylepis.2